MKILLIAGAGGHGKVIADIAIQIGRYRHIYFMDDGDVNDMVMGIPVIGKVTAEIQSLKKNLKDYVKFDISILEKENIEVVIAIGNSKIREEKQKLFEQSGYRIAVLVHPSAVIGSCVKIGAGTVVMPQAVINADSVIGKGCIINTAASVDHENRIGDYCHISVGSHLAGMVRIGKHTWIGIGAVVSNNLTICEECMIGAGAVVVKDVKNMGTYIGVPAEKSRD